MAKLPVSSKKFKVSDGSSFIELCQLNAMLNAFWQIMPCAAATTANLTATYANVTSGVGATLTNAGTQAAFAVDGVTLAVGARVLIKDQTTAFQNGLYTVTTAGSASVNWVLTRSTDFDTITQMIQGIVVDVFSGSANTATSWMLTSAVTAIGTSSLAFSKTDTIGVTSVIGTANRISVSGSPSTPQVDIPPNPVFLGQYIQLPVVNSSSLPSPASCVGAICVTND